MQKHNNYQFTDQQIKSPETSYFLRSYKMLYDVSKKGNTSYNQTHKRSQKHTQTQTVGERKIDVFHCFSKALQDVI